MRPSYDFICLMIMIDSSFCYHIVSHDYDRLIVIVLLCYHIVIICSYIVIHCYYVVMHCHMIVAQCFSNTFEAHLGLLCRV